MAEWVTVENRAGDLGARMISRNGVFSSSPVDIAELAVERRGVSALTRGPNRPLEFSNPGEDLPDDFAITSLAIAVYTSQRADWRKSYEELPPAHYTCCLLRIRPDA
jgi:hypothetical protein